MVVVLAVLLVKDWLVVRVLVVVVVVIVVMIVVVVRVVVVVIVDSHGKVKAGKPKSYRLTTKFYKY